MEPIEYNVFESSKCNSHDDDHGWKKVVSRKRNLKQKPADEEANGNQPTGENVNVEAMNENQKAKKTKKSKPKKEMKPIVPFSEAAAKIDPSHLAAYLVEISMTLCGFVLFSCNPIFTKLAAQQGGSKGGEDPLATFIALGMVLRSRPNALAIVLPTLRGETILSNPKARTILVNCAVREKEQLIPPPSFKILLRLTFPTSSARVKATERFEAIYPLLKEVVLAGSKTMKQSFILKNEKVITEGGANASLYKEANKYCKVILGRLSHGSGCLKATITVVVLATVGTTAAVVQYICF
ncbi:predicted protein [Arabidopsis lyrata subsp. lyrata]|uniref:Predicted protein n=1 Tax=Arabidopsis lyrata subsp. lyrata TaxID=81972 RepID=D7LAF2_ARALL|nr:predicted protein [Arabidopsis lyrata subsp. lyrata]